MGTVEFFLLIYAAILVVNGLFILIDSKSAGEMFDEIISSKSIGRIWASLFIVLGIAVLWHGYALVWEGYAWVLPLLGWISLIKGVSFYWWPNLWSGFKKTATSNIIVSGLLSTAIGIALLCLVF